MTDLRKAAQQALEALVQWEDEAPHAWSQADENAVAALRAALAEPEQEPDGISWLKRDGGYFTAPTPRKPLTDEDVKTIWDSGMKYAPGEMRVLAFARAIERAHGIGESND